jgi:hypothetical protein
VTTNPKIIGIAKGFGRRPVSPASKRFVTDGSEIRPASGKPVPRCEFCSLLVDVENLDAVCYRAPDHVHHCAALAVARAERDQTHD